MSADEQSMSHFATDLGRVAHALPDALLMLEAGGTISWVNQTTLDLLGIEPLDWSDTTFDEIVHDHDRPTAVEELGITVTDVRLRDGLGRWRRFEVRSRTIPNGDRPGFVVLCLREAPSPEA